MNKHKEVPQKANVPILIKMSEDMSNDIEKEVNETIPRSSQLISTSDVLKSIDDNLIDRVHSNTQNQIRKQQRSY